MVQRHFSLHGNQCTDSVNKQLYCRWKHLILFPDQISRNVDLRNDRPDSQRTVACCVYELIKADGIAKPVFHKERRIVNKIVGCHYAQSGQLRGAGEKRL